MRGWPPQSDGEARGALGGARRGRHRLGFSGKSRPARQGRNPRTGGLLAIDPSNALSFRAGNALKDGLN